MTDSQTKRGMSWSAGFGQKKLQQLEAAATHSLEANATIAAPEYWRWSSCGASYDWAMFEVTEKDGARVLRLAHGKPNALDLEFCEALALFFKHEREEPAPLVLTGSGRIFSAGVDLPRVLAGGDAYITAFLHALDTCFLNLFTLEKPVVAAVNGHAIAGGCILAAACDSALMVNTGASIGVPELAVGVPFPPLPMEILRHAVGTGAAQRLAFSCENVSPEQALQLGLVQRLVNADELLPAAIAEAARLGAVPQESFALVKRQLHAPAMLMVESLKQHAEDVAHEWHTPEVKQAIQRFVDARLRTKP